MDKKHLLLLALLLLPASASFADNPASKETLDRVIGAGTLSPTDWTNLCAPGQSIDSLTGCTPNINGAQKAAVTKLFVRTRIQSLAGIPITDNNGIVVFHIAGSKNISHTVHNDTMNYAVCIGFPVDNFPNEAAYNNPDTNPLYQFSILDSMSPGGTRSFTARSDFYDYYAPTTVNDYLVCVGGSATFSRNTTTNNSSKSIAGLFLT